MKPRSVPTIAALSVAGLFVLQMPCARVCFAQSNTSLSAQDQTFLNQAAQTERAQVELDGMTKYRALRPRVSDFGQQMAKADAATDQHLKVLAQSFGYRLPENLTATQQHDKAQLAVLSGGHFDIYYIDYIIRSCRNQRADFKREASDGQNPKVKAFAAENVSAIEQHLHVAQEIKRDLTGQAASAVGP